jgi:CheY-like chemotaxis protein
MGSRILLADDSPHAQRMGERILREEGFEVVTVTDGETALIRIPDVDPDLILADVFLPNKNGYELCEYVKTNPKFSHTRVVLLAGLLEPVDEAEMQRVKADAVLKKPLEASAVMATVRPLIAAAMADRVGEKAPVATRSPDPPAEPVTRIRGSILGLSTIPVQATVRLKAAEPAPKPQLERFLARTATAPKNADSELVRAAVTIALDRAMPALIDEITGRVLEALRH